MRGLRVRFVDGKLSSLKVLAPSRILPPPLAGQLLLDLPGKTEQSPELVAFSKTLGTDGLQKHKPGAFGANDLE